MIKLTFVGPQRRIISFDIDGKDIIYYDNIWKKGIKIMPKDENLIRKMLRSGEKSLKVMVALIFDANKGESLEEYNSCKTEEDLAEMIRKDCSIKGLLEAK